MTNQVKVPKEIQELFYEAAAFSALSLSAMCWLIPSPKAYYYALRAEKVDALAWRTLKQLFPQTAVGEWKYDLALGVAFRVDEPVLTPKAPRVPRKTKIKQTPAIPPVIAAPVAPAKVS